MVFRDVATAQVKVMNRPRILEPQASYTFSKYFDLTFDAADVFADLDCSFERIALDLPQFSEAIEFKDELRNRLQTALKGSDAANQILRDLNGFEVSIHQGMESYLWQSAAYYKATLRRISLADCFALALTKSIDAMLVTSDRGEFTAVVEKDLCRVQFIR